MLREHLFDKRAPADPMFRWRGGEVSRLEALTDAVFAFALTLLVVSLEVPATYAEMVEVIRQFPAFAVCFALLVMCWYYHYQFFRRFGLEDFLTILLNTALLFLVLFYVYPLKFVFTRLFSELMGGPGAGLGGGGGRTLMLFFAAGYTGIFLLFALLHLRAWSFRDELELDRLERYMTRASMGKHLISASIGVASFVLAWIGGKLAPWSGLVYFAMGPAHFLYGYQTGAAAEKIAKKG